MKKEIITEIIINGSREKVWNVLTDFAAYPQWNPFIVKVEGTAVKGTRLKNTLLNGSKTYQFEPLIMEAIPNESFSWLGSLLFKGLFDGLHSFKLEEAGEGQVKLIHGERFSGMLSGYILKKIGADTRNNFVKMNQALKERVESI